MCVYTHVCTYVHECTRAHTKPSLLFLSCLLLCNPSLKQKFSISARVPGQGAIKSCQSLSSNSRAVDMFWHYVFIWVLGIWTQVFILAHVLLPISYLPTCLSNLWPLSKKFLEGTHLLTRFSSAFFSVFFKWQYIPRIAFQTEIEYVVSFAKYTGMFLIHHRWAFPQK